MAIKINFWLFFTLMIFASVSAQKDELTPNSPFEGKTYDIDWIIPSADMKFITFQKIYDYSSDTLALVSTKHPDKILFQTPDVYPISVKYTKRGAVFMSGSRTAQLVNLITMKPQVWEELNRAFFLEQYQTIVLLKKENLQILNSAGEILEEIKEVVSVQEKEHRLFYTQRNDENFSLKEWTPKGNLLLAKGAAGSFFIDYLAGTKCLFHENLDGNSKLYYADNSTGITVAFPGNSQGPPQVPVGVSALKNGSYLVTFATQNPKVPKNTSVDVWYPNDHNLGKKFYNDETFTYILWTPQNHKVVTLDHHRFPKHTDTGNGRYLLAYDPALNQDYTFERIQQRVYRYDTELDRYEELGLTGIYMYTDKEGKYLLSHDNLNWVLYNIDTGEKSTIKAARDLTPFFSVQGDQLLFPDHEKMITYDLKTKKIVRIKIPAGYDAEIAGGTNEVLNFENKFYRTSYEPSEPLAIKITNNATSKQAVGVYSKGKFQQLCKTGPEYITMSVSFPQQKKYLYVKRNYNAPPVLVMNKNFKEQVLFKTNPKDHGVREVRMEKISYTNSKGVPLTGLLYYPSNYKTSEKYPMVVGIYELMRNQSNQYLRDGMWGRVEGMNIRYYLDRGYFIYLPDIVYDGRGTGRSALDCVDSGMNALAPITSIDFEKVGLMGHSHGGYETNYIATQSNKFATYVGGAGNSDLVRSYHSFNYDYFSPFYWQFEEQQYRMFKSFAEDKNLYIDNSPIYYAEKVSRPILLWTGTKDQNILWEQTMEFYLGLRRNHKEVIALFYGDEGHSFGNKANREDLFLRISHWFDYYLKGVKKEWIDEMY
ncbi:alpha/beta hydrolase family protein [Kaistella jeonii]|uniref:alpha/beta hydrolase family protein n=1 Tax=Kaistella jeonii TaxID=266749 RepID=UPI00068E5847|nr:prolyl oligopeptidase family serine peptidase [Kaistella jeonii]SFC19484.1 Dipeptidyl aminopeptidase/acylaminoacyl peptidase [Kaistella jeonii]VEI97030.1 Prolyl oligopeptidase family [Kaistella jeonii]